MRHAPANRAGRVQNWPAGGWKLPQNAKKILFIRNELKNVLEIKELAILRRKNELYFERQKHKTNSRIWPKAGSATSPSVIPSAARNLALRGGSELKANYEGRERTRARFLAALGMTQEGVLG
jgi:hypothetical protein